MHSAIEAMMASDHSDGSRWLLVPLAEAYAAADRTDEGSALLARGRAQLDRVGPHYLEAELHRVRGELLRRRSPEDFDEADAAFREALQVARRQRARLLELRAAVGLARLLETRGRKEEARAGLADVYGWFTEGFDTLDLTDAKALLEELT